MFANYEHMVRGCQSPAEEGTGSAASVSSRDRAAGIMTAKTTAVRVSTVYWFKDEYSLQLPAMMEWPSLHHR